MSTLSLTRTCDAPPIARRTHMDDPEWQVAVWFGSAAVYMSAADARNLAEQLQAAVAQAEAVTAS